MRRADRLFRIVQFLRVGRMITASRLAEKLQVSARTIYRDVRDLQLSGMPIEGEAGVGYLLRRDFDIPPLMFTRSEIEALVLGARMVRAWGGTEQGEAAIQALHKIEAALPSDLRDKIDQTLLYAPNFQVRSEVKRKVDLLNAAASGRKFIEFGYIREDGEASHRRVRPLALYFWGGVWTLASWCEMRNDFRSFRVDRMEELRALEQQFPVDPRKSLRAFIEKMRVESSEQVPTEELKIKGSPRRHSLAEPEPKKQTSPPSHGATESHGEKLKRD